MTSDTNRDLSPELQRSLCTAGRAAEAIATALDTVTKRLADPASPEYQYVNAPTYNPGKS
jgi:hypothetical protein